MTLNWAMQVADEPEACCGLGPDVRGHARADRRRGSIRAQHLEARRPGGRQEIRQAGRADRGGGGRLGKRRNAGGGGDLRRDRGTRSLVDAWAWLDCEVRAELALGSHSLFVGEVVGFGFADGGEEAPVLRMEDTRMNYGG